MKAKLIAFNGIFGKAYAEDGRTYFVHKNEVDMPGLNLTQIKNLMGKTSRENPVELEFEPNEPDDSRKRPYGTHIRIIRRANWKPQHTTDGFWLENKRDAPGMGHLRCSSCGHTNEHPTKFCPHCGVPMTRTPDEDGYLT